MINSSSLKGLSNKQDIKSDEGELGQLGSVFFNTVTKGKEVGDRLTSHHC